MKGRKTTEQKAAEEAAALKARQAALGHLTQTGGGIGIVASKPVYTDTTLLNGAGQKVAAAGLQRAEANAAAASRQGTTTASIVAAQSLPDGWFTAVDASDRLYYYHRDGRVQWEKPTIGHDDWASCKSSSIESTMRVATASSASDAGPAHASTATAASTLPLGWFEATSPDGKPYYYTAGGQVQWERPGMMPAQSAAAASSSTQGVEPTTHTAAPAATGDSNTQATAAGEISRTRRDGGGAHFAEAAAPQEVSSPGTNDSATGVAVREHSNIEPLREHPHDAAHPGAERPHALPRAGATSAAGLTTSTHAATPADATSTPGYGELMPGYAAPPSGYPAAYAGFHPYPFATGHYGMPPPHMAAGPPAMGSAGLAPAYGGYAFAPPYPFPYAHPGSGPQAPVAAAPHSHPYGESGWSGAPAGAAAASQAGAGGQPSQIRPGQPAGGRVHPHSYRRPKHAAESSAADPLDPTGTGGRWGDGLEDQNRKRAAAPAAAATRPAPAAAASTRASADTEAVEVGPAAGPLAAPAAKRGRWDH